MMSTSRCVAVPVFLFGVLTQTANSFHYNAGIRSSWRSTLQSPSSTSIFSTAESAEDLTISSSDDESPDGINPDVAEKFKIVTCMSTSCSQKRKNLGLDDLATFGAMYSRAKNGCAPSVQVEEGPCQGACKMAPCIAIEHDDFVGSVALEGMTDREFSDRV